MRAGRRGEGLISYQRGRYSVPGITQDRRLYLETHGALWHIYEAGAEHVGCSRAAGGGGEGAIQAGRWCGNTLRLVVCHTYHDIHGYREISMTDCYIIRVLQRTGGARVAQQAKQMLTTNDSPKPT